MRLGKIKIFLLFILLATIGLNAWPSKVSAEQVFAHWEDRATIIVDNINLVSGDEQNFSSQAQGLSVDALNGYIDSQAEGEYRDGNIGDNILNPDENDDWTYSKSNNGCDSVITFQEGGFQLVNLRLNVQGRGCFDVFRTGYDPRITVNDNDNSTIWFEWINENTMVRVDGRDGNFVRSEDPNQQTTYYRIEEAGRGSEQDSVRTSDGLRGDYDFGIRVSNMRIKGQENRSQPPTPPGETNPGDEDPTCESRNSIAVSWLLCGVLDAVDNTITSLASVANELLTVRPGIYNNESIKEAWSYFRNLASLLLVVIGLVMVIGQALGRD